MARAGNGAVVKRPAPTSRSVVFFAGQDWWYHNRAHSDMQLAQQLSAGRRVLLINSIGTRMPIPGRTTQVHRRIIRKLRSISRFVRRPVPELPEFYVYSPVSVPLYQSVIGRWLNSALIAIQVGIVRRWLRIRTPDVIVTPPTAAGVVRRMRLRSLTFNRSDKHSAWVEVDQSYVERCERELLSRADVVLYVSHALMAEDEPTVGTRALFLDHGVDTALFDPVGPIAEDLAGVPSPRIGYFGALRDVTVDVKLLEQVAEAIPGATVVIVGPSTVDLTGLLTHPNVRYFGSQPHESIPSFGRGFDVAIMPWHDNDWIRNCNPVKLKEYLSLGLPIVTTDFPEAHRYEALIDIARDRAEFIGLCRAAVTESADPGAAHDRRRAVAEDSWRARGQQLASAIDALATKR